MHLSSFIVTFGKILSADTLTLRNDSERKLLWDKCWRWRSYKSKTRKPFERRHKAHMQVV